MKLKELTISKALLEVWEWKDEVYKDIKDKTFEGKQKYYQEGIEEAVKRLKGKLISNSDGSYSIVKFSNPDNRI
ncbi:MAG: hypothetical protein AB1414_16515 [bacterium]